MIWGSDQVKIVCETSTSKIRPYIPKTLRRRAFEMIHRLSHPGGRATSKTLRQRYFWPSMCKDVTSWARSCEDCQKSKISRHVKTIPEFFKPPDARFNHIHMDIVGPLPTSQGYNYLLTIINRFSRWPEAYPVKDTTAATIAQTFYTGWVCRYGTPKIITTDQGAQFESRLFTALLKFTGTERIRTTAYHPASNGLVERWHRCLKASLMCHGSKVNWVDTLPTVLLGLRTCLRDNLDSSPAEFLFGTTLRVPGEFFNDDNFTPNPQIFIENYREYMKDLKPVPDTRKDKVKPFCFKDLKYCTHVFVRCEGAQSLERPYEGPFKIIRRSSEKVYVILRKGEEIPITKERLKPAHLEQVFYNLQQNLKSGHGNVPNKNDSGYTATEDTEENTSDQNTPRRQETTCEKNQLPNLTDSLQTTSSSNTASSFHNPTLRTYPAKKKVVRFKAENEIFIITPFMQKYYSS